MQQHMSVFRAYPRFLDPRPMDAIFFISAQILLSTIHCFELFAPQFRSQWVDSPHFPALNGRAMLTP